MIRKRTILAATAALLLTAITAPAVAAEAPPTAHQTELARRLFADMQMDRMMRAMMDQMGPAMTAQIRRGNPSITDDQARALGEAMSESMAVVMPKMMDRMVPLYAATFSEKELEDVVAFYEGPSGKAMLAKMPKLTAQMVPMMTEMMPDIVADMQKRVCAKIDCTKTSPPPKT